MPSGHNKAQAQERSRQRAKSRAVRVEERYLGPYHVAAVKATDGQWKKLDSLWPAEPAKFGSLQLGARGLVVGSGFAHNRS